MKFHVIYQCTSSNGQSPVRVVEQATGREIGWINRYLDCQYVRASVRHNSTYARARVIAEFPASRPTSRSRTHLLRPQSSCFSSEADSSSRGCGSTVIAAAFAAAPTFCDAQEFRRHRKLSQRRGVLIAWRPAPVGADLGGIARPGRGSAPPRLVKSVAYAALGR
jgi:hypothetical protein